MKELLDELLCPICLQNFSMFPHLDNEQNVQLSKGNLDAHVQQCKLPYSSRVHAEGSLEVFYVSPNSPTEELLCSAKVAETMSATDEVPGDLIGWYTMFGDTDLAVFLPCAFIPATGGKTAGILVVRRKPCTTFDLDTRQTVASSQQERWCVDRIWVYTKYRRAGIARTTVEAAARFFSTEPVEMGFSSPLSAGRLGLARALCGTSVHLSG